MIIVNYRPKICIYRYVLIDIVLFCCFDVCSEIWYTRETWGYLGDVCRRGLTETIRPGIKTQGTATGRPQPGGWLLPTAGTGWVGWVDGGRERERERKTIYIYIYIYCHRAIGIRMERILKERGTTLYVSHLCALSPKFTPSRLLQMCHHGCSTCQCPNISYPSAIKHGHG